MGTGHWSSSRVCAQLAALMACGPMAAADAQAAALAYPAYPVVRTLPAMADWLRANTDVQLGSVIGVGDDAVFSLEPTTGAATPPTIRATIRQEVTSAAFAASLGGRSAVMVADLDCDGARVFQRALDLYAGNNRQGAVRHLGAAAGWQAVPTGTFMGSVLAAVCDPDFRPVYPGGQVVAAAPAAPPQASIAGPQAPPRFAARARSAPAPALPSIALIAPATRPRAPAVGAGPVAPPPSASTAPAAPRLTPTVMAPVAADGPITTQPSARPPLIAPQAAPPSRAAPAPAAPAVQVAQPVRPPALVVAPPPVRVPVQAPAGPPAPPPAAMAPTAVALGLRPLTLGRAELGVFTSLEAATAAWDGIGGAFPQALEDKRRRVELTTRAGQTRFRLFADGFGGAAEAVAFCRELRAGGQACTVTD